MSINSAKATLLSSTMKIKPKTLNLIALLLTVTLSVITILVVEFVPTAPSAVKDAERVLKEYTYEYDEQTEEGFLSEKEIHVGTDLAAVDISDLAETGLISKVNYIPNEFVDTGDFREETVIVDLTEPFEFASKGTLYFAFLPPDPASEDYATKKALLEKYRVGDNWVITVGLPQIFSACNIYANYSLRVSLGVIRNYDYSDHTVYYSYVSNEFSPQTDIVDIDLSFPASREQTVSGEYYETKIITVHYESDEGISAIAELPLVGLKADIDRYRRMSGVSSGALALVAILLVSVYVVLSASKRTSALLPDIVTLSGLTLVAVGKFVPLFSTSAPHFWYALATSSPFIAYAGVLLALSSFVKNKFLRFAPLALPIVGFVLKFIAPYSAFRTAAALDITCIAVSATVFAVAATYAVLLIVKTDSRNALLLTTSAQVVIAGILCLIPRSAEIPYLTSTYWIAVSAVAVFLAKFVANTAYIEARNRFLTRNLKAEVKLQTEELSNMLRERDDLIRFVSHDVRKTVTATQGALRDAVLRESDPEQIKLLNIATHYNNASLGNLTEVAGYSKFNYLAEPSATTDSAEVVKAACDSCLFDCEANGIRLHNACAPTILVYAKPKGLENVLVNLIMNAVEHADCQNITVTAEAKRDSVVITVSDDGKGISLDADPLSAYVTEKSDPNGGVGLYVCANIIRSMGGTLTYASDNGAKFLITLPKA